ncbi:MAG: hypothetical protein QY307_05060 [Acidimicrobiia bacterium]|nr:MAG: hypothetical protein QY307_05060 [Acidimicrobiia bacterium]
MRFRIAAFAAASLLAAAPALAGDTVAVTDLLADSAAYDSDLVGEITVRGELVGDFMRRDVHVWVQINGDPYVDAPLGEGNPVAGSNSGIGARIPNAEFDALGVERPGGYRVRGPIVVATGEWRHHDQERGGESYLEVHSVVLEAAEREIDDPWRPWAVIVGGLMLALGVLPRLVGRRG